MVIKYESSPIRHVDFGGKSILCENRQVCALETNILCLYSASAEFEYTLLLATLVPPQITTECLTIFTFSTAISYV